MRTDSPSFTVCWERHSRVAKMIIHLQQDECFTGQYGHGSFQLIASIIN